MGRKPIAFAGYVKDFVRGNWGKLDVSYEYWTNQEDRRAAWAVARLRAVQGVEKSWNRLGRKQLSSHDCDAAALNEKA